MSQFNFFFQSHFLFLIFFHIFPNLVNIFISSALFEFGFALLCCLLPYWTGMNFVAVKINTRIQVGWRCECPWFRCPRLFCSTMIRCCGTNFSQSFKIFHTCSYLKTLSLFWLFFIHCSCVFSSIFLSLRPLGRLLYTLLKYVENSSTYE